MTPPGMKRSIVSCRVTDRLGGILSFYVRFKLS